MGSSVVLTDQMQFLFRRLTHEAGDGFGTKRHVATAGRLCEIDAGAAPGPTPDSRAGHVNTVNTHTRDHDSEIAGFSERRGDSVVGAIANVTVPWLASSRFGFYGLAVWFNH
jgi:hypothetical protein